MQQLFHFFRHLLHHALDVIFPSSDEARALQNMSPDTFVATIKPAESLHDMTAYFAYRDPFMREAIWQIKYRRNKHVARLLAVVLADHLLEDLQHKQQFEHFVDPILIPIPLSKKRKRERGYNQVELITSALDPEHYDINTTILSRTKHTESQARTSNRDARIENMKGCFHITNPESVRGKNIIVLDDVITTGSTLCEARKVLLEAGARSVWCVGVAH